MSYLILSILLTTALFVLFKWFDGKALNLLYVIIGNYITCIATGWILSPTGGLSDYGFDMIGYHLLLGVMFFLIFYLMGISSSKIGVGVTGTAGKMSLILTVIYTAIALYEPFGPIKIIALILALASVILFSYSSININNRSLMWMPLMIFIGSGLIDIFLIILKHKQVLMNLDQSPGIMQIFTGALITASIKSILPGDKGPKKTHSLIAGVLLGLVNYFSVHFMLLGLVNTPKLDTNEFYMINNTGVVLSSFIAGLILFKEKIDIAKIIGMVCALLSIYLTLNN